MKRLLLLFIPLIFFFSCEEDGDNPTTGYNCAETGCVESASAESGYFSNLEDCENNCEYCEICTFNIAFTDADTQAVADASAVVDGFTDFQDYMESSIADDGVSTGEVCGDDIVASYDAWLDLSEGENTVDFDGNGIIDVTYSYSCE